MTRLRSLLGVWVKDLPRYLPALAAGDRRYLGLCNRGEKLEPAPDGSGYRCDWQWTSDLRAPLLMPRLGMRLMQRSLRDHPIRMNTAAENATPRPRVSFIIGHRGDRRLPHLLKTLESIAGQQGVVIECLVVEQDAEARLTGRLPAWVRHLHTPPPAADMPYCRSWAFNIGARAAAGEMLILHDNDLLVSADYAARSLERMKMGFDLVNLKRFGFYLDEAHTQRVFSGQSALTDHAPESIMQNMLGGGSIAIGRDAYLRIGGMDEGFIGWGGEDNEFWERAQTLRVWPYGCLPLVHLWHPAQAGKYQVDNPTLARYREQAAIDPQQRILALNAAGSGSMSGPAGWDGASARVQ
jgi:hypothetical protein